MTAIILDTETTSATDPQIIEAAWIKFDSIAEITDAEITDDSEVMPRNTWEGRFKPSKPIEFGAMATHNIIPEDLINKPPHTEFRLPGDVEYVIGHQADYDMDAVRGSGQDPKVKRICTLAIARKLWPEADSHKLGAMTYFLADGRFEIARIAVAGAHGAMADCFLCMILLEKIIAKAGPFADFEALWVFSEQCRIPTIFSFGKFKGSTISEVRKLDPGYIRWCLSGKCDMVNDDPYWRKALTQ